MKHNTKHNHTRNSAAIVVCSLFWAVSCVAASSLPPPSISIAPDIFYPQEEALYVEGKTTPGATVHILLQQVGETPLRFELQADEAGIWILSRRVPLTGGYWEVRVQAIDTAGNESSWSSERTIRAVETGVEIAGTTFKFSQAAILLVLLTAGGITFFIYAAVRSRTHRQRELLMQQRRKIKELERRMHAKEIGEATHAVRESFRKLKEKERTPEELGELEDSIEKEIRDLEDMHL